MAPVRKILQRKSFLESLLLTSAFADQFVPEYATLEDCFKIELVEICVETIMTTKRFQVHLKTCT